MEAHGATGLARLPEELVDLVCSFVVDFEVRDTTRTLCSLAQTSHWFLEPARRALLHDPSRIITIRRGVHAHLFLHRIIRRPSLAKYVKRLDFLVDLFNFNPSEAVFIFINWGFTLLRYCANLVSVAIWPNLDDGWLEELLRLPHLRHLIIAPRRGEVFQADHAQQLHETLRKLPVEKLRLKDLVLRRCGHPWDQQPPRPAPIRLPPVGLELSWCAHSWTDLAVDISDIRDLVLAPHVHEDYDEVACEHLHDLPLPAGLETLVVKPLHHSILELVGGTSIDYECSWQDLFLGPLKFLALREVTLFCTAVDRDAFETLCTAAPSLERIDLRGSFWYRGELHGHQQDAALVEALSGLPRLRFLHLGQVPGHGETILDTRVYCGLFGIELEYRCEAVEPTPVAMPSDPAQDPPATATLENDASLQDDSRRLVSFFSSSNPTPSLSPSRPSSPSSDLDVAGPTCPSHPGLRRTPSPTPTLDDADLAASATTIVARTTADTQQYVDAPAAQPRLEPGFEAQDDGVDDELDDAAPWDGWGSECEMSEADRAWCECDDEGVWECTRALAEEG
ncbi:hypothetical protein JCM3775_005033 [Rhodotorula graminis]